MPIKSEVRGRKEAEEFYTKHPVNSTFIYDRFPVPPEVDPLTLCLIEGVNVNCCRGPHTATTGELKASEDPQSEEESTEGEGRLPHSPLRVPLRRPHHSRGGLQSKQKEEAGKSMKAGAGGGGGGGGAVTSESTAASASTAGGVEGEELKATPVKGSGGGVGGTAGMPAFEKWRPSTRHHIQMEAEEMAELLKGKVLSAEAMEGVVKELERRLTMFSNVCYSMGFQAATDVPPSLERGCCDRARSHRMKCSTLLAFNVRWIRTWATAPMPGSAKLSRLGPQEVSGLSAWINAEKYGRGAECSQPLG